MEHYLVKKYFMRKKVYYEFTNRILDVVFSITLLVVTFPVILLACLAVMIESRCNPIYTQKRLGKNGREFTIYKIRSMKIDAEKDGARWANKNDDRITRVGRIIRVTRIDELPQLINIFWGDMAFIGPRPEREIFIKKFEADIVNFRDRLIVKPGLTGLAQVSGGYDLSPKEKLEIDLEYIRNRCFLLDIKIIIKTIKVVLSGEGAR
ncbi:sugar transferase [Clostridium sp. DSM 100503]|uniref:sugar transferase n=1 Tax=Clostridium sp. DSM 100503 TaxID=2963282 RepID=UPI002149A758|nr:sugar transferase [Clostridium sp. DSM 100503]MCR1951318.1 sugar transferase [Clostridium sp. DSM 100503]